MKWRNRARRLLQMILLLRSISSLPPSFSLNLLSSLPSPPLPRFSFSCFSWFVPQTHIDPHALDPVGGLVPLRRSTAHDWHSPYGRRRRRRRRRYTGGIEREREREKVSQWKTEQPWVQGGGSWSWMWFMINGASPITFQLKASLKHGSSTPHRRRAFDRLCSGSAIPITMAIYAGTSSLPHTLSKSIHKYLCAFVYMCVE